ncbi:MAG: ABC transporter ATP-binding protein [Hyphomicrobiaceae bacterium]|nr:ABC transporter ATP-binding protein [Hyphomicrobiaceae bacterium]
MREASGGSPVAARPPEPGLKARAAATFAARVQLEGVTKAYDDAGALNGIDLDVKPGEIVCLLGPSGCGKTTLLRVISGIERPSLGRVLINEREVAGPNRFVPPENRGVGLMFQDFALFPHLTVLDNVAFGLKALARDESLKAARAILDRVGLLDMANIYPSVLSGGQQQRVALARAIVPRPAVMLMDEPFSGLDVQLREAMQEETLALLRETRATSLIVTHHPEEAMRMGDRIVVLRRGRVVQAGRAEDLYRAPADLFVARLFSEINEFPARVRSGKVETPVGAFPAPGLTEGADAVVCLRERGLNVTASATAGGGLPGRILGVKFLGDSTRLDVAVSGFERPLKVRVDQKDALAKGAEVKVDTGPGSVLVFAAETDT